MQVPVRLTYLLRPSVSKGILLAVGFSTFVLSATPFLFRLVADHYGLGLGLVSLIGVGQLGGFVVGSWGAGRWLSPRRRVFILGLAFSVAANLASVALPPFPVLVALRVISGLSLGLISWFAWVQVFGDDAGTGDVAVIGPVAGIIAAPLIAVFARNGAASVFALLGTLALIPLVFNTGTGAAHRVPSSAARSSPVPVAVALLGCLALFTVGGSTVFQYTVILGSDRLGLSTSTMALLYSGNSLAAIPASRWPGTRRAPGLWMALTGMCAVVVTVATTATVFGGAIVVWGFMFWMGLPGAFKVLAERSANPADRAGDAQAVMAAGRVVGPLLGGLVLDGLGAASLGAIGGGMMITSGALVFALRRATPVRVAD